MVGRQLPIFSLIVPFWVVWAFAGWKGMKDVWPAILVTGVSFAVPQFLISNYVNPWIVDIGASLISMGCLVLFLRVWQPKVLWLSPALRGNDEFASTMPPREADRSDAVDASGIVHGFAAMDHSLCHPAYLGHGLVQGRGQSRSSPGTMRCPNCTT